MPLEEKLLALNAMGYDDSDEVLLTYLRLAGWKIIAKAYPFRDDVEEVPEKYGDLQVEIAAYLLDKRGATGQLSHSENGVSRTYESADVPPSMLRGIIPCCGVMS